MTKELDVSAKLAGGMRFDVETGSGYEIRLDMAAGAGGEGTGPQPMEMLLVGLAGCAGMSTLLILRKRKQDVRDYAIKIHGERAEVHPQVFTEITVEHIITGKALKPEIIERALLMTEQKYCGASVMLEKTAHIRHTYRIVEVES
ncbi:MAG: OsmC family protein [Ktedonobacteraceae bacterium]